MAALPDQGLTSLRDAIKTLVTHIAISDDGTAFATNQTGINPSGGTTSTHVEACTKTNVDGATFDATFPLDGSTEFTGKVIHAISVAKGVGVRQVTGTGGTHSGGSVVGTDIISRNVRPSGLGIGVIAGDTFTPGVRVRVLDSSP